MTGATCMSTSVFCRTLSGRRIRYVFFFFCASAAEGQAVIKNTASTAAKMEAVSRVKPGESGGVCVMTRFGESRRWDSKHANAMIIDPQHSGRVMNNSLYAVDVADYAKNRRKIGPSAPPLTVSPTLTFPA